MNRCVYVLVFSSIVMIIGCLSPANQQSSGLVLSKPGSAAEVQSGPVLELAEKQISLGTIPEGQVEIVGWIPVFNPGTEPLQIQKVTGPCSCFKSYSGDKLIKPGTGAEIEIRFDGNKIPAGKARKLVRIESNDIRNRFTDVYFEFTIDRDPAKEETRILRAELAGVKKELRLLRADMNKLIASVKKETPSQTKAVSLPVDTKVYDVPAGSSPFLGTQDAPVTIVEFFDFQCPYCISEYPKLRQLVKEYSDKVRVILKHYPLKFHKKAPAAHAATQLALQQQGHDGFWKMHDMITGNPDRLDIKALQIYAETLGLDMEQFESVLGDESRIGELIRDDKELAERCNVRATPTVFVNGLKLTDRSVEGYRQRISQILNTQPAAQ